LCKQQDGITFAAIPVENLNFKFLTLIKPIIPSCRKHKTKCHAIVVCGTFPANISKVFQGANFSDNNLQTFRVATFQH